MNFTLMIYLRQDEFSARTDPARQAAFWGSFIPYMQALKDAGIVVGGAGLQPPDMAATVRQKDGQRTIQAGPYADTKEQIGGFFVIDVPDIDTALAWAARYPAELNGVVEVRPNIPSL